MPGGHVRVAFLYPLIQWGCPKKKKEKIKIEYLQKFNNVIT